MRLLFFYIFFLPSVASWTPSSWRDIQRTRFIQKYSDKKHLENVQDKLKKCFPLVSSYECNDLKQKIHQASTGKAFVLMGGDCAESLENFSSNYIRDMYRLLLQMGLFLSYANGVPTIKISRMAGQFAKPRSDEYEKIQIGKNIEFIEPYKGDIINGVSKKDRQPDPERMIKAYYQSSQTLNFLRSFSFGGYASVHNIENWNLKNTCLEKKNAYYEKIKDALRFMKGLDLNIDNPIFTQTKIFTGHESLLLQYEEPLTRRDEELKKYFACSAHFLWVGERTRDVNSPHVEYLKGVHNPIGIKISSECKEKELVNLIQILNPNNDYGRITLITRFGKESIESHLPRLVKTIKKHRFHVLWCCDPVHGNTKKLENGVKTRFFHDIWTELKLFFEIHYSLGTIPGGLHLEMTPNMVTECIDFDNVFVENIQENYESKCDPRLNAKQSVQLICNLCDFILETNLKNENLNENSV
jgi:3-deoxy-7-phosphoheptulonate synthase